MAAVQLTISYETLVALIEQLSDEQRQDLMRRLRERAGQQRLTADDRLRMLRAAQTNQAVKEEPSPRREDWYNTPSSVPTPPPTSPATPPALRCPAR